MKKSLVKNTSPNEPTLSEFKIRETKKKERGKTFKTSYPQSDRKSHILKANQYRKKQQGQNHSIQNI